GPDGGATTPDVALRFDRRVAQRAGMKPAPTRRALARRPRKRMPEERPRWGLLVEEPGGDERRGGAGADDPELVGGAGGADVELIARVVALGVALGGDVDEDDVVVFEALHLADLGDLDAGAEGEVEVL